jgi:hypothetical protein
VGLIMKVIYGQDVEEYPVANSYKASNKLFTAIKQWKVCDQ